MLYSGFGIIAKLKNFCYFHDQILADFFYINNANSFNKNPNPTDEMQHQTMTEPPACFIDCCHSLLCLNHSFLYILMISQIFKIWIYHSIRQVDTDFQSSSTYFNTSYHSIFSLFPFLNKCLLTVNIRWFNWSAKHISQFLCQIFAWFFPVSYGHDLRYGSSALDSFIDFFCYSTCLVSFVFLPKYANLSENSSLGSILLVVFEREC